MDGLEPGLFDLPVTAATVRPVTPQRGRNRETWSRTVSAEVTITDTDALCRAVAEAEEHAVVLYDAIDDDDVARPEDGTMAARDPLDSLVWLVWPTQGFEPLLEAGACQIRDMDARVEADSAERGTLTWTVKIKLTDVAQLRRLATHACPEESDLVAESFAAAWQHAADPFAPIRDIPGITWQPAQVAVEHVPARSR